MISCKLAGGLGNYMFQIATANTLAFKNNTIAKFNFSSAYQVHTNITYYADNIFRNVTNGDCELFYQYDEPSFSFNELPYKNGLLLNGYFQSERKCTYSSNFRFPCTQSKQRSSCQSICRRLLNLG